MTPSPLACLSAWDAAVCISLLVKMENPYFIEDMCVSHEAVAHPGESWLAQLLVSWASEQRPGAGGEGPVKEQTLTSGSDTAVPLLNGEKRPGVSNRNKNRFAETVKDVLLTLVAVMSAVRLVSWCA